MLESLVKFIDEINAIGLPVVSHILGRPGCSHPPRKLYEQCLNAGNSGRIRHETSRYHLVDTRWPSRRNVSVDNVAQNGAVCETWLEKLLATGATIIWHSRPPKLVERKKIHVKVLRGEKTCPADGSPTEAHRWCSHLANGPEVHLLELRVWNGQTDRREMNGSQQCLNRRWGIVESSLSPSWNSSASQIFPAIDSDRGPVFPQQINLPLI